MGPEKKNVQSARTLASHSAWFSLYCGLICGVSGAYHNLDLTYRLKNADQAAATAADVQQLIHSHGSVVHTNTSLAVGGFVAGTVLGVLKRSKYVGSCAVLSALLAPAYGQIGNYIIQ